MKYILPPYVLTALLTTTQAVVTSTMSSILSSLPPPLPLICSTLISLLIGVISLCLLMEGRAKYGPIANGGLVVGLQFLAVSVLPKLSSPLESGLLFWLGVVLVVVGLVMLHRSERNVVDSGRLKEKRG